MHLLVSREPFMLESALQILGAPVFRNALQLPMRPQDRGETFTLFDAPPDYGAIHALGSTGL